MNNLMQFSNIYNLCKRWLDAILDITQITCEQNVLSELIRFSATTKMFSNTFYTILMRWYLVNACMILGYQHSVVHVTMKKSWIMVTRCLPLFMQHENRIRNVFTYSQNQTKRSICVSFIQSFIRSFYLALCVCIIKPQVFDCSKHM